MDTTTPRVNGAPIPGRMIAFDGCHKLYVCPTPADEQDARECGYQPYPVADLPLLWAKTCGLEYLYSWSDGPDYILQGEGSERDIVFTGFGANDRTYRPGWQPEDFA